MGKPKRTLKQETVMRIRTLLRKYSSVDELLESKEYISLYTHYMNAFEKSEADTIIDLCKTEYTFDEIKFIIEGESNSMSNKNTKKQPKVTEDPVEQETIFMISQQKVIDAGRPVEVTIGEDNIIDVEGRVVTDNQETFIEDLIVDQEEAELSSKEDDPIILGKVVEDKKKHNHQKKLIETASETNQDMDDKDASIVMANVLTSFVDGWAKNINRAIETADDKVAKLNARMEAIRKESEKHVAEYIAKCAAENPKAYAKDYIA